MNELNWVSIGVTSLLSSTGAFLATYISFVYKKKEKKHEYKLELEKRIISELNVPIYELEENLSYIKKYIEIFKIDGITEMIVKESINDVAEILILGERMTKASELIKRIVMVNTYYLVYDKAEMIIEEMEKVSGVGFFCKALLNYIDNKENKDEATIKPLFEEVLKRANDYDSAKVHNVLPELFS